MKVPYLVITYVWCESEVPYLLHGITVVDAEVNICGTAQDKELQTENTKCSAIVSIDHTPLWVKTQENMRILVKICSILLF
jgi:hypothetical protein